MFSVKEVIQYQWQRCLRLCHFRLPSKALDEQLSIAQANTQTVFEQTQVFIDYFWKGQQKYLSVSGLRAYYPGYPSMHGSNSDGIEGISRLLPLFSVWISLNKDFVSKEGNSPQLSPKVSPQLKLQLSNMQLHLQHCFANGTNPDHASYWGDAADKQQLICEASDIALALWLSKDHVFNNFSSTVKMQILQWLCSFVDKEVEDNNWHLFPTLIDAVLAKLDPQHCFSSEQRLKRILDFAVGHGAFKDGMSGNVDYYNAWGFHYSLFWINQIYPNQHTTVFNGMLKEYVKWYQYLFTKKGLPIYGRSLCYRYAAATPLLAAACLDDTIQVASVATLANKHVWDYFTQNGGISKGRPNQGLFADNPSLLDNYSGPSSAFWGTRSLVMQCWLMRTKNSVDFPSTELPSEQQYEHTVNALNMKILTKPNIGEVEVYFTNNQGNDMALDSADTRKNTYYDKAWKNRLRELLYAVAFRAKPSIELTNGKVSSNLSRYL